MTLIVGLGNPGAKYQKTRHNIGFITLNAFKKENKLPDFKLSKKFNAFISSGIACGQEVILAKPQTFMNDSGKTVKSIASYYKKTRQSLIIVHDDIDLPLASIKISISRGSAGHKGVESIVRALGTKDFARLRIGILPAKNKPNNPEKFVLKTFTKNEEQVFENIIYQACQALNTIITQGPEQAMNKFN